MGSCTVSTASFRCNCPNFYSAYPAKEKPEPDNIVKASATLGMRWAKSAFDEFLTRNVRGATIILTKSELSTLLGLAIEDGMRHVLKKEKK